MGDGIYREFFHGNYGLRDEKLYLDHLGTHRGQSPSRIQKILLLKKYISAAAFREEVWLQDAILYAQNLLTNLEAE